MPIYAYRCTSCGFEKDVLQKMSDERLTICPECKGATFNKQVTAAGFQLKGNGWYATDFKGGNQAPKTDTATTVAPATTTAKAESTSASSPASSVTPASTSTTSTPPTAS